MNIVILEDQISDRDILLAFLEKYALETGYDLSPLTCKTPEEIPEDLSSFHAALLDIIINGKAAGVDTARALRKRGFKGPIVFLTTSRDYYAEGFEVDAAHYLVKPYTYQAFCEAMVRLIRQAGSPRRMITLQTGRRKLSVPENEILYVEVYGKETLIHTTEEDFKVFMPLREVEALLADGPFLRCFRSCIVNMDYIIRIKGATFILKNGAQVPITLRNKEEIRKTYLNYRFEKIRRNDYE